MKKILILSILSVFLFSCTENTTQQIKAPPKQEYKYETVYKIVKNTKEKVNTYSTSNYTYDLWNDRFVLQPEVHTDVNYYVIYTDGTYEEITMEQSVLYSPGDSIAKQIRVPI